MYFKLLRNINIFDLSCIFGKMIHFPTSIEPTTKRSSAYYHGSNESPSVLRRPLSEFAERCLQNEVWRKTFVLSSNDADWVKIARGGEVGCRTSVAKLDFSELAWKIILVFPGKF